MNDYKSNIKDITLFSSKQQELAYILLHLCKNDISLFEKTIDECNKLNRKWYKEEVNKIKDLAFDLKMCVYYYNARKSQHNLLHLKQYLKQVNGKIFVDTKSNIETISKLIKN